MVLKTGSWADEIARVTGLPEYQTCTITVVDRDLLTKDYDPDTDKTTITGFDDATLYEGQARFIPVRAGVPVQGEAQANSTTLRAVRFQVPRGSLTVPVRKGCTVTFVTAPFNPSLAGRTAQVTDDFQGSTSASRTIHAMMDIDAEIA